MLWQEEKRSFTNNYNVALKGFNMLKQRLKRGPHLRKKYEVPSILTSKRVIQRSSPIKKHLLCHPVYTRNQSEKFQMVFDATVEYNGNTLNKALLTRHDLLRKFCME